MKKIIFHISMILIGVLGVLFGTMPDIFPTFAPKLLIGEARSMEIGYNRLIEFTKLPSVRKADEIALGKNTPGYWAIIRILHSFNPNIVPPVKIIKNYSYGNISTDRSSLMIFVNPGISLAFNKVIYFQTNENTWEEVCELRDVHYIIEAAQGRFYAKIGFFLALVSILIDGVVGIRDAVKRKL